MLATPWPRPFIDPDWSFEIKWDGVRALVTWDGRSVEVRSRAGNDATSRYPELTTLEADRPLVLDGEIVALDESGRPSFEKLQGRMNLMHAPDVARSVAAIPISCVVFDILYDGTDITGLPFDQRRERLLGLDLAQPFVTSTVIEEDPSALWQFVVDRGIEGIVAKRAGSGYRPGTRSPDWRKITHFKTVRAVVGGYLPGERGRSTSFGSLLVGVYTDQGLRWIGAVGSGFSNEHLAAIRHALDAMTTPECPFVEASDIPPDAVWVEPRLVAMVQYKEFTGAGRLRGPSFKGFTDDDPRSIAWADELGDRENP